MNRRLVKHGEATLMVSLPARWLREKNLGKGDEISVEEENEKLILTSSKLIASKKIKKINLKDSSEYMSRLLFMNYVRGYDEIHIRFEDLDVLKSIRTDAEELIGFEIFQESENLCILKNIAKEIETEFDPILRNLVNLIEEQATKSLQYLGEKNFEKLEKLKILGRLSNKYCWFCLRITNNKKYVNDNLTASEMYTIVWYMEQISDVYSRFCAAVPSLKKNYKIKADVLKYYGMVISLFKLCSKIYYHPKANNLILEFRRELENIKKIQKSIISADYLNSYILLEVSQVVILIDHLSVLLYT